MAISKNQKDREYNSFIENINDGGTERRVTDKDLQNINKNIKESIDIGNALNLARSAGFHDNQVYDSLICDTVNGKKVLEYSNEGICQFQVEIVKNGNGKIIIKKKACESYLTQENGFRLLTEDDKPIKAQGLIP